MAHRRRGLPRNQEAVQETRAPGLMALTPLVHP